jgi:hypothetical protein
MSSSSRQIASSSVAPGISRAPLAYCGPGRGANGGSKPYGVCTQGGCTDLILSYIVVHVQLMGVERDSIFCPDLYHTTTYQQPPATPLVWLWVCLCCSSTWPSSCPLCGSCCALSTGLRCVGWPAAAAAQLDLAAAAAQLDLAAAASIASLALGSLVAGVQHCLRCVCHKCHPAVATSAAGSSGWCGKGQLLESIAGSLHHHGPVKETAV